MAREKKVQIVDEMQKVISECNIGILTDYRGLPTSELDELRRALRKVGTEYRVVKNSLAQFAAEKAGRSELIDLFKGPTAIAFSNGDITEPAKALANYIRDSKSELSIRGGFLRSRVLTAGAIETLATLPSREILLNQVLAGMQSPMVSFISLLTAPIKGVMGVLQARIKQLEGE
jgi:large subunit ribosomal protein L10